MGFDFAEGVGDSQPNLTESLGGGVKVAKKWNEIKWNLYWSLKTMYNICLKATD